MNGLPKPFDGIQSFVQAFMTRGFDATMMPFPTISNSFGHLFCITWLHVCIIRAVLKLRLSSPRRPQRRSVGCASPKENYDIGQSEDIPMLFLVCYNDLAHNYSRLCHLENVSYCISLIRKFIDAATKQDEFC